MEINLYNSDHTPKTCPNGASVDYPIGKIQRVLVGNGNCQCCPCWQENVIGADGGLVAVRCSFPNNKHDGK